LIRPSRNSYETEQKARFPVSSLGSATPTLGGSQLVTDRQTDTHRHHRVKPPTWGEGIMTIAQWQTAIVLLAKTVQKPAKHLCNAV